MKYIIAILPVANLIASAAALPAEPSNHHVSPRDVELCGGCSLTTNNKGPSSSDGALQRSAFKCSTLPKDLVYDSCINVLCGLCVMFMGDDCSGDTVYWGGPSEHIWLGNGARSYTCT